MCTECRRRDRTECCELEAPVIARCTPSKTHIGSAAVSIMAAGQALDGTLRPSEGMKCVGVTNVTSDKGVSGDVSW